MKDIHALEDLQGMSEETYTEILRLAEKHKNVKRVCRPRNQREEDLSLIQYGELPSIRDRLRKRNLWWRRL
jgi:P2-related tail formation protein